MIQFLLLFFHLAVIVDQTGGVELHREERYDTLGNHHGYTYTAHNTNPHPVLVTIDSSNLENAYDGLSLAPVEVPPNSEVSLGWVIQADPNTNANWDFSWRTQPKE